MADWKLAGYFPFPEWKLYGEVPLTLIAFPDKIVLGADYRQEELVFLDADSRRKACQLSGNMWWVIKLEAYNTDELERELQQRYPTLPLPAGFREIYVALKADMP